MRFAHRILSGLVFIAILLPGRIVVAQEVLQEIVVTAQKRTQNLQDVPVAVDAFSGAALTDAVLSTLARRRLRADADRHEAVGIRRSAA